MGDQDLYDLQAGPAEGTNRTAGAEHAGRPAEMREASLAWWNVTGGMAVVELVLEA